MRYSIAGRAFVLLVCLFAAAVAPVLVFRLSAGPAPNWNCGEDRPMEAAPYLVDERVAFVLAGAATVVVLLALSRERRKLTVGEARPGAATICAAVTAAMATALFLAVPVVFAYYIAVPFLSAAALLDGNALGLLPLLAILVGIVPLAVAATSGTANAAIRLLQATGWCLLAVGLPLAFVFMAPFGPLYC